MAKIMDDNFVEYVADAVMDIQSRESSVLPALRKQLEEAESGITNMLNASNMLPTKTGAALCFYF